MTADPTPAPMVQLPAETVDKLREAYNHRTAFAANVIAAARAVVDAADSSREVRLNCSPTEHAEDGFCVGQCAAAEQADKGEAAESPRTETEHDWTCTCAECEADLVRRQHQHAGAFAPNEPACRCGHTDPTHGWHANRPCNAHGCPCAQFEPRVPSNDEAEASTVASFAPLLTPEERASLVRNLADGPLRWVSREFADFPEIRFDKANEIMGRLEPLLESLVAARLAETWRRGYLDHAQFEPPSNEYIDALNPFRADRQGGNSDEK